MPVENESRKEVYDSRYDALIERMPELEGGIGIMLDRLSVNYLEADRILDVFYEMRSVLGKKMKTNIDLNVVLYDLTGRIVDKDDRCLSSDDWMGFAVKEFTFCDMSLRKRAAIGKIRVFPTKVRWN